MQVGADRRFAPVQHRGDLPGAQTLVIKQVHRLAVLHRQLPVQYREAVHLFYYEGLSTRQIASVLDRSEATIRSDLHRGREQLKRILKEAYDFEV